jgi:hypothetical protein
MAARKWLLVTSQSLYVGGFTLGSWAILTQISRGVLGMTGLPYVLLGATGLLSGLAATSHLLLSRGRIATRAHALLTRLPSAWLRARLRPLQARFTQTDGQLRRFFATALSSPLPLLAFLVGWVLEAADTLLILYLLGVRLPWTTVGSLEVAASFLRNVAFVVPAGLGVQDLSYLTFLRALNVADAVNVTAAFLLLKRGKECFWALCGYAVLALDLRSVPVPESIEQIC